MRAQRSVVTCGMVGGVVAALTACNGLVLDLGGSDGGRLTEDSGTTTGTSTGASTAWPQNTPNEASAGAATTTTETVTGTGDAGSADPPETYGGIVGARPCLAAPTPEPDGGDDAGAALTPLVGTWTGFLETLPSGAGNLTLVFTQQADGSVAGTMTFGTGAPPPPPTAKTDVFPPGFPGDATSEPFPYAGFPYTTMNMSFDGARLQLGMVTDELWKTWCGLQTSYDWSPNATGLCGCLPDWSGGGSTNPAAPTGSCSLNDPATGQPVVVSCALFGLCQIDTPCSCSSAGCSVDMRYPNNTLDVVLSSNQLTGSISGIGSGILDVVLTQSP